MGLLYSVVSSHLCLINNMCYTTVSHSELTFFIRSGMPYPSPELQTAASDSTTVCTAECGVKRKVLEDAGVEKKRSKQLVSVNAEGVNTALQKLSGLLDECSSKQRELAQKLKIAVCGDGNLMETVASSQM